MAEKIEGVGGTARTTVTQGEDGIHIDTTSVPRCIYVTGFPATTKSADLIIHFQRMKNGGGDIEFFHISKRRAAVITFDNPEGKNFMVKWPYELDLNKKIDLQPRA